MGDHIGGLVAIIILVFNALVIAARKALENINEVNIQKLAEEGDEKALLVTKLNSEPHKYLDFTSVFNMLTGIILGMIFAFRYYEIVLEILKSVTGGESKNLLYVLIVIADIFIIQFIIVVGVILPKKIAIKYSDSIGLKLSGLMSGVLTLFKPLLFVMEKGTNLCLRIVGINPSELVDNMTEEEIISIVNEGQEQGVLEETEAEMISNIIELDEKEVKDIMTHRRKIVAISTEITIEEALNIMLGEKFSRFPLYSENIDNIVGILHLKDVMQYYISDSLRNRPLSEVARKAFFIPDTQNVNVLFREMQAKKMHMAVAIDEYGQTAGIVAMEDILEEIVGDIQDEYDEEEELIVVTDENKGIYEVNGETKIEELKEEIGIEISEEETGGFDTLSGFLVSKLDHIPNTDDKESIEYNGYVFNIEEVKDNMISKVIIKKLEEKKDEEQEEEKV